MLDKYLVSTSLTVPTRCGLPIYHGCSVVSCWPSTCRQLCFEGPIHDCSSLQQVGAVPAVVVAAEHASRQAPNGWQEASPRPSMDERACQPLPQAISTPTQTLCDSNYLLIVDKRERVTWDGTAKQ